MARQLTRLLPPFIQATGSNPSAQANLFQTTTADRGSWLLKGEGGETRGAPHLWTMAMDALYQKAS